MLRSTSPPIVSIDVGRCSICACSAGWVGDSGCGSLRCDRARSTACPRARLPSSARASAARPDPSAVTPSHASGFSDRATQSGAPRQHTVRGAAASSRRARRRLREAVRFREPTRCEEPSTPRSRCAYHGAPVLTRDLVKEPKIGGHMNELEKPTLRRKTRLGRP